MVFIAIMSYSISLGTMVFSPQVGPTVKQRGSTCCVHANIHLWSLRYIRVVQRPLFCLKMIPSLDRVRCSLLYRTKTGFVSSKIYKQARHNKFAASGTINPYCIYSAFVVPYEAWRPIIKRGHGKRPTKHYISPGFTRQTVGRTGTRKKTVLPQT